MTVLIFVAIGLYAMFGIGLFIGLRVTAINGVEGIGDTVAVVCSIFWPASLVGMLVYLGNLAIAKLEQQEVLPREINHETTS